MGKSSTNMGTHVTTFDVKLVLSTFIVICLSILFNEVIMFNSDDDDDSDNDHYHYKLFLLKSSLLLLLLGWVWWVLLLWWWWWSQMTGPLLYFWGKHMVVYSLHLKWTRWNCEIITDEVPQKDRTVFQPSKTHPKFGLRPQAVPGSGLNDWWCSWQYRKSHSWWNHVLRMYNRSICTYMNLHKKHGQSDSPAIFGGWFFDLHCRFSVSHVC